MIQKNLVSIIIANWNGGDVFEDCLKSIKKIDYPNWELIIVDNGSSDGSDKIAENIIQKNRLKVIKNIKNFGYAIANNQGYQVARGKYLLLLNNDTLVKLDFLSKLVERIEEDPSIAIIQPKIFVLNKKGYIDNAGSHLTITGFMQHWGYMEKDRDEFKKEKYIFSSKGACMLIKKDVVDKVGLFDEDFGSYFEETDFCFRVWINGFKVLFYPKAQIYHKIGFSSKKQNQFCVFYHSSKNRICALIKNLELHNLFLIGGLHLLINLGLSFYYLITFKIARSYMILKSIFWNLVHLPQTIKKRKLVQRIREKKDSEIFKDIVKEISLKDMLTHFQKVEANFK